jgi:hypothetical protein
VGCLDEGLVGWSKIFGFEMNGRVEGWWFGGCVGIVGGLEGNRIGVGVEGLNLGLDIDSYCCKGS